VNSERNVIAINEPARGSDARVSPVSRECVEMLNRLPKKRERIFSDTETIARVLYIQRQRLAYKLENSRLRKISFHTLRHFKGTMEYHKTRDILHVKYILGHRNNKNTLIYIQIEKQLFQGAPEDFISKVAETIEDALELQVGFEYVGCMHGAEIFRKRR